ncbi:MAG: hypothetical protein OHK0022_34710 [Roseiflexaceae bacterium]
MNASTFQTVNSNTYYGDHAIVIGGSIAGLLTASVLTRSFAQVTIIERDRLPEGAVQRKGVPQARHAHQLLTRGAWVLEELLPGIGSELLAAGAREIDCFNEIVMLNADLPVMRMPPGPTTYAASRDLLEWVVRQRVNALPQVQWVQASHVTGLLTSADGKTVTGVSLQGRTPGAQPEELIADLVVDASGRSSRTPEWLEALGYGRPEETVIDPHAGYASRVYARPNGASFDGGILVIPERPDLRRSGVIMPLEGDRWLVTLIGFDEDLPPNDEEGFLAFARGLQHRAIFDLIKQAMPLSAISGYRRMENQQRHYERMERWPEGLVVLGDAAVALNPLYGQGMTLVALAVQALDKQLRARRGVQGMGQRFQRELAQIVKLPWMMATSASGGGEPSGQNPVMRLVQGYMTVMSQLFYTDPEVYATTMKVTHMIASPLQFYRPTVVARVLRHWLRGKVNVKRTPRLHPVEHQQ